MMITRDVCKTLMPPFPQLMRIDLTFDLLTWISWRVIYMIYSSWTIYIPSLTVPGQKALLSSPLHKLWETNTTFNLEPTNLWPIDLNIHKDHLLIVEYIPSKFDTSWTKRSWVIFCTKYGRPKRQLTLTFNILTWISISNHLLIKDYLPAKFDASWAYRPTNSHVQSNMPPFTKGGITMCVWGGVQCGMGETREDAYPPPPNWLYDEEERVC